MTNAITLEIDVHFRNRGRGNRRELRPGPTPLSPMLEPGRVPRVARLMALAIRFEELLRLGQVTSYSEFGRIRTRDSGTDHAGDEFASARPGHSGSDSLSAPDHGGSGRHPPAAIAADCLDSRLEAAKTNVAGTAIFISSSESNTPVAVRYGAALSAAAQEKLAFLGERQLRHLTFSFGRGIKIGGAT